MTTLLVILAVWVGCSIPLALIVARMFRSTDEPPKNPPGAVRAPSAKARPGGRMATSWLPAWGGRTNTAHLSQDGARAATGSRSAH